MKKPFYLIAIAAVFLAACAAETAKETKETPKTEMAQNELTVKIGGKEQKIQPVSTWAYHSTYTNTTADGQSSASSSTTIVLANFALDTSQAFVSINNRKIEKPEELKVVFSFLGEKGTNAETPIKKGEYPAEGEVFNKIRGVTIHHFADGKEKQTELDSKALKGKLTIKSVEGTTVSGEIDVTDGTNMVKGTFSANGHKSVK